MAYIHTDMFWHNIQNVSHEIMGSHLHHFVWSIRHIISEQFATQCVLTLMIWSSKLYTVVYEVVCAIFSCHVNFRAFKTAYRIYYIGSKQRHVINQIINIGAIFAVDHPQIPTLHYCVSLHSSTAGKLKTTLPSF